MRELLEEVYLTLQRGDNVVVATIISDSGSTPRASGAKMIVFEDGTISGTIGGGALEGDAVGTALGLFATRKGCILTYNLIPDGNAREMDLICGGRMRVLFEHVSPAEDNLAIYKTLCREIQSFRPLYWTGRLVGRDDELQISRAIYAGNGTWYGTPDDGEELASLLETHAIGRQTAMVECGGNQYMVEQVRPPETLYIVGGGHVSKEIALFAKQVGFRILVFDDRVAFANSTRFASADGVYVRPGYAEVFNGFDIGEESSIIIVTRGHSFDKEVLGQALRTEAGYIGMIGSSRKKATIYKSLTNEGVTAEMLEKVHCPIGLAIGAETPAEIGISVVAQLIAHRAGRSSHD